MTIQSPETRRTTTCPHCEDWPLSEERDTGGVQVYVCTNCGCAFSPVALSLVAAGDGCPMAAMEDEGR
jgi:transcription elongation factor Elf1